MPLGSARILCPSRLSQVGKWDFGGASLGKLRIGTEPKGRRQSEHKIPAGIARLEQLGGSLVSP